MEVFMSEDKLSMEEIVAGAVPEDKNISMEDVMDIIDGKAQPAAEGVADAASAAADEIKDTVEAAAKVEASKVQSEEQLLWVMLKYIIYHLML